MASVKRPPGHNPRIPAELQSGETLWRPCTLHQIVSSIPIIEATSCDPCFSDTCRTRKTPIGLPGDLRPHKKFHLRQPVDCIALTEHDVPSLGLNFPTPSCHLWKQILVVCEPLCYYGLDFGRILFRRLRPRAFAGSRLRLSHQWLCPAVYDH